VLTKDIDAFVNGSWCFPYLMVVPLNVAVSGIILFGMVRVLSENRGLVRMDHISFLHCYADSGCDAEHFKQETC